MDEFVPGGRFRMYVDRRVAYACTSSESGICSLENSPAVALSRHTAYGSCLLRSAAEKQDMWDCSIIVSFAVRSLETRQDWDETKYRYWLWPLCGYVNENSAGAHDWLLHYLRSSLMRTPQCLFKLGNTFKIGIGISHRKRISIRWVVRSKCMLESREDEWDKWYSLATVSHFGWENPIKELRIGGE